MFPGKPILQSESENIKRMLDSTDILNWKDTRGTRLTHDLFKFPGKFHPPLVERILATFSPTAVLDPMGGVGTAAIESRVAGIPSLTLDIDPLSVFFARVKSTPIEAAVLREAWDHLRPALDEVSRDDEDIERLQFEDIDKNSLCRMLERLGDVQFLDELDSLDHWFRNYVLLDFARIDHSIRNGGLKPFNKRTQEFFSACLLASVRRISNADPSPVSGLEVTQHMRDQIAEGYRIDVLNEFERRVERFIPAMKEFSEAVGVDGKDPGAHIQRAPAQWIRSRAKAVDLEPDLIFFSPPYCNAIEYWRRHRLEYMLGGFLGREEIIDLKRDFVGRTVVGGRAKVPPGTGFGVLDAVLERLCERRYVKKAHLLWLYFRDMKKILQRCYDTLVSDGTCVLVVGDSTTRGMRVPTRESLVYLGEKVGFTHKGSREYRIENRVMQFPTKNNSKIESESVLIFRK